MSPFAFRISIPAAIPTFVGLLVWGMSVTQVYTTVGQEAPTGGLTVSSKQEPTSQDQPAVAAAVQQKQDESSNDEGPSQFDKDVAFNYLKQVCAIGPRVSASPGMKKQQKLIQDHFKALGGKLYNQAFYARSPYTLRNVKLHNLIVRWHPRRKKRLLICCHYDTRPFPDRDPVNPQGTFIGANDGASGVALLMELGKHMQELDGPFGVDFIFFDGEEFVIQRQRDPMFLGSTFFRESVCGRQDRLEIRIWIVGRHGRRQRSTDTL